MGVVGGWGRCCGGGGVGGGGRVVDEGGGAERDVVEDVLVVEVGGGSTFRYHANFTCMLVCEFTPTRLDVAIVATRLFPGSTRSLAGPRRN